MVHIFFEKSNYLPEVAMKRENNFKPYGLTALLRAFTVAVLLNSCGVRKKKMKKNKMPAPPPGWN